MSENLSFGRLTGLLSIEPTMALLLALSWAALLVGLWLNRRKSSDGRPSVFQDLTMRVRLQRTWPNPYHFRRSLLHSAQMRQRMLAERRLGLRTHDYFRDRV